MRTAGDVGPLSVGGSDSTPMNAAYRTDDFRLGARCLVPHGARRRRLGPKRVHQHARPVRRPSLAPLSRFRADLGKGRIHADAVQPRRGRCGGGQRDKACAFPTLKSGVRQRGFRCPLCARLSSLIVASLNPKTCHSLICTRPASQLRLQVKSFLPISRLEGVCIGTRGHQTTLVYGGPDCIPECCLGSGGPSHECGGSALDARAGHWHAKGICTKRFGSHMRPYRGDTN